MDDSYSLLPWWQKERIKDLDRLREKAKSEPLSDVEHIVNPYSLQQARNQVRMLNGIVDDFPDRDE